MTIYSKSLFNLITNIGDLISKGLMARDYCPPSGAFGIIITKLNDLTLKHYEYLILFLKYYFVHQIKKEKNKIDS